MVLWGLEHMEGGEVFVPKIPSYRILDVADAICSDCTKPVVGIRPGEKLHEEMITESDSYHTIDLGEYFAILPSTYDDQLEAYAIRNNGKRVEPGLAYRSDNNPHFLTADELRSLIANTVID